MNDMKKSDRQDLRPLRVTIEGTLDGKKITPDTLGLEKFGQVFNQFNKLVEVSISRDRHILSEISFRFEEGSAILVSDLPQTSHQLILDKVEEIKKGHPINIVESKVAASIYELKELADSFDDGAVLTIGDNNTDYITLSKRMPLEQFKEKFVDTETVIYGKLFAVGGKNPNIHISPAGEGDTIIIDVDEKQAKELAGNLYDDIGVLAMVKKSTLTGKIAVASFLRLIPYSRVLDEGKFKKDKKIGTKVWANIDPVKWENEQRGYKT